MFQEYQNIIHTELEEVHTILKYPLLTAVTPKHFIIMQF